MDLITGHKKSCEHIDALRRICETGSPFVFLCAYAFIDYLAKLKGQDYQAFIDRELAAVRAQYHSFTYYCGERDLPRQMWYVLRCGLVHSFSLIPDDEARKNGGRDRSITLLHRQESSDRGIPHLSHYSHGQVSDAAALVAEDLIDDIEAATERLFSQAEKLPRLRAIVELRLSQHPPLTGGF